MDRLILTKILSLSTRHLVILAALVERNADNSTGDTYNTYDWFGHLGNVARQLRSTSARFADMNSRDLYREALEVLTGTGSTVYHPHKTSEEWAQVADEMEAQFGDIQYAVKPEVYALKDIIIAAARTRLRQESQEWIDFKADVDSMRNHPNALTRSSL